MKKIIIALALALGISFSAGTADAGEALVQGNYSATPYVELKMGNAWQHDSRYDNQGVYGGAVGLDFGKFRTEFEAGYFDMGGAGGSLGSVTNTLVSVNVFAEPVTISGFTPYVGGGIGYGWFSGSGHNPNNEHSIVYNVGGGVTYDISKNWMVDVGYRYYISDENNIVADTGEKGTNYKAHVATAGLRYNF